MTTSSIAAAILIALLSGQSASDRQAYATYQIKLSAVMATDAASGPAGSSADAAYPLAAAAEARGGCMLVSGSGNTATTSDCMACHSSSQAQHSHPVDVYQDSGRSRSLRRSADVVKRGVFLADGKVTCLSCHDGSSMWKHKIALPPDAQLREPVNSRDVRTYDPSLPQPSPMAGLTATTGKRLLPPGTEVSPTPLCKACHSFD